MHDKFEKGKLKPLPYYHMHEVKINAIICEPSNINPYTAMINQAQPAPKSILKKKKKKKKKKKLIFFREFFFLLLFCSVFLFAV